MTDWSLHHNNALDHSALSVRAFLARNKITVSPYPPYSLVLATTISFLLQTQDGVTEKETEW
jgi:hypothetical protein